MLYIEEVESTKTMHKLNAENIWLLKFKEESSCSTLIRNFDFFIKFISVLDALAAFGVFQNGSSNR
jgi:hypothetical protein